MVVTTEYVNVPSSGGTIRTFVAAPRAERNYPGIWCYSDIFQLTPPMLRSCVRLAGYGFVAAAPEIYARIEPPGTVIPFDDAGRTRGQEDAAKMPVAHFDADCRAGLDWLGKHAKVAPGKIDAFWVCLVAAIKLLDQGHIGELSVVRKFGHEASYLLDSRGRIKKLA